MTQVTSLAEVASRLTQQCSIQYLNYMQALQTSANKHCTFAEILKYVQVEFNIFTYSFDYTASIVTVSIYTIQRITYIYTTI